MSEEKKKLLKRLKKARKNSINFDKMVYLAEMSVEDFIKNLIEDNNKPSIIPHSPKKPKYTLANILIPIVPVTPNELELLLEYLNFKYLKKINLEVIILL